MAITARETITRRLFAHCAATGSTVPAPPYAIGGWDDQLHDAKRAWRELTGIVLIVIAATPRDVLETAIHDERASGA
jgi:hypothetical protein